MDERHPVTVFACGEPLRGDDGLAACAVAPPAPFARDRARLRTVTQLTPDDLQGLPTDARVVIVDAVVGVEPGRLVRIELDHIEREAAAVRSASSHQLALAQVIEIAAELGARPAGVFLGVGARSVGLGDALSAPVRGALPRLRAVIGAEVERLSRGRPVEPTVAAGAGSGRAEKVG